MVYIKYEKKLHDLEGVEKQVGDGLNARLAELDAEAKNIKTVLFDAKLQFRSNELKEETYQQIKVQTDELIEHITNEKTEIGNVRAKLAGQTIENVSTATAIPTVVPTKDVPQEQSAPAAEPAHEVEPAQANATEEKPVMVSADAGEQAPAETSWLNQVIAK
jgi:hypothetical protein